MKDILEEIVAHKRQELEAFKQFLPPRQLYSSVEADMAKRDAEGVPSMREALLASDTGIIAEFKRKSPSKGWINKDAKADVVPLQYQDAVSCQENTDRLSGLHQKSDQPLPIPGQCLCG